MNNNNYCVILAGGRGRRLWPCSRDKHPKQFVDLFGTGRTQIQATFDRFCKIMPKENIFVCTNTDYAALVKEQLPELPDDNIIYEPVNRGTAPCVAWAVMKINVRNADACVTISPSDELVLNEQDRCYHLGTADGPAVYVNLEKNVYGISMLAMVGEIIFDSEGNPIESGTSPFRYTKDNGPDDFYKEEYTEATRKMITARDKSTGVYPLTEDLHYILTMGVDAMGWARKGTMNYLFNGEPDVNEEIAWMFLMCHAQGDISGENNGNTGNTGNNNTNKEPVDPSNPQTGDMIGVSLALMMSTGGAAVMLGKKKRK